MTKVTADLFCPCLIILEYFYFATYFDFFDKDLVIYQGPMVP